MTNTVSYCSKEVSMYLSYLLDQKLEEKNINNIISNIIYVLKEIDKKHLINELEKKSQFYGYVDLWLKIKTILAIVNIFPLEYSNWSNFNSYQKHDIFISLCKINSLKINSGNILNFLNRIDKIYSIKEILNKERKNNTPNLKEWLIKIALSSDKNLIKRNKAIAEIINKYDLDVNFNVLSKILILKNCRIHNLNIYDVDYDKVFVEYKNKNYTAKDMIYYYDVVYNIKQLLTDSFTKKIYGYDGVEYTDKIEYLKSFLSNQRLSNLIREYLELLMSRAKINKPFYQYCILKVYVINESGKEEKRKKL